MADEQLMRDIDDIEAEAKRMKKMGEPTATWKLVKQFEALARHEQRTHSLDKINSRLADVAQEAKHVSHLKPIG